MSEFSKLKQQRNAKEANSYSLKEMPASQIPTSHELSNQPRFTIEPDMVPTHTTGPIPLDSNGLYPSLTNVLDVRVNGKKLEAKYIGNLVSKTISFRKKL